MCAWNGFRIANVYCFKRDLGMYTTPPQGVASIGPTLDGNFVFFFGQSTKTALLIHTTSTTELTRHIHNAKRKGQKDYLLLVKIPHWDSTKAVDWILARSWGVFLLEVVGHVYAVDMTSRLLYEPDPRRRFPARVCHPHRDVRL